jgi:hypothetical protein
MPTTIKCPMCKRALEVPDELMGKRVKCPGCKMIFTATPPGAAPSEDSSARRSKPSQKSEEAVRRRRPSPPPDEDEDEEDEEEEEQPRVRKKATRRREEDYEDEKDEEEDEDEDKDEEEEDEEDSPRRPRKRSSYRQRARSVVLAPAISLMVVGSGSILFAIFGLILNLAGGNQADAGIERPEFLNLSLPITLVLTISQLCVASVITLGAIQMKNLTSYGYAVTASIAAMLPCTACCIAGIPIGIWSLIVIHRSDVKSAWE